MPDVPVLMPVSQYMAGWLEDYAERVDARISGVPRGAVTGLKRLDAILGGCLMPGLHFVTGKAGTGKSAFLLQAALNCGVPVVYVTCELSGFVMLNRLMCVTSGVTMNEIKQGAVSLSDVSALVENLTQKTLHMNFMDGSGQYLDHQRILDACETARTDHPSKRMLLIIDSFHAWSAMSTGNQTEYMNLRDHVTYARQLSSRLKSPVVLASEQNRMSKDGSGGQAASKGYGVEYSAETLINLELSAATAERKVAMNVYVEKNRHGTSVPYVKDEPASYQLEYDRWTQRFKEI
jgi:replicative DNA helicase